MLIDQCFGLDNRLFLIIRFPRREDVERSNSTRMRTLNTETHEYTASHGGKLAGSEQGERLLTNFMAPGKLTLKLGAQVPLSSSLSVDDV